MKALATLFAALVFAASHAKAETSVPQVLNSWDSTTTWSDGVIGNVLTQLSLNISGQPLQYTLLSEQTANAATQTFSLNGQQIFAGSAVEGATFVSNSPLLWFNFNTSFSMTNWRMWHSGNGKLAIGFEDGTDGDFNDMVIGVSRYVPTPAVPEPATYAFFGAGLAFLFIYRRRIARK